MWLITGCSTGFGHELAKLVLERGWRAVVTARDPKTIAGLAERYGGRALVRALDVTQRRQIDQVVADASIKQSAVRIDAYASTAGERRRQTEARSGSQAGDPVRGAQAIIDAALSDTPPLRLLLGRMALDLARRKVDSMSADFDAWETTTVGADYPEPAR